MIQKIQNNLGAFITVLVTAICIVAIFIFAFLNMQGKTDKTENNPEWFKGDPNSKVVVEIFEDYGCSHCRDFSLQVYPELISTFEGQSVKFINKHFILGNFAYSKEAAIAAEAAGSMGKFFEYHELLFNNQGKVQFNPANLINFAQQAGLDINAFKAAYNSQKYQSDVNADVERAKSLKVQGTPSFAVNGKLVTINTDILSELSSYINEELKK